MTRERKYAKYQGIKKLILRIDFIKWADVYKRQDLSIQKLYNPSFIAEKGIDKEKIAKLRKNTENFY